MRHICTRIDIDVPPQRVWEVLTDFTAYAEWNPFIREAAGRAEAGSKLTLRVHPRSGRPITFRPTVLAAEPYRLLRWLGHLAVRGLFDGAHQLELTATAAGTHLAHSETFTGILVPVLRRQIADAEEDFRAFDRALKARAEEAVDTPG
ncbi:hypothetical protein GCM10009733_059640 [Nonomuraea maheshkhaliensis]|uniref:SRPBCC domain-containing protein n=1 Tax=Nonomuraea maheshkhaliensis TaxID=419590 RepID=A0ABN2FNS7_9ACTN